MLTIQTRALAGEPLLAEEGKRIEKGWALLVREFRTLLVRHNLRASPVARDLARSHAKALAVLRAAVARLATEQKKAAKIVAELRPVFRSVFSKRRRLYGSQVGSQVRVKVLPVKAFQERVYKERWWHYKRSFVHKPGAQPTKAAAIYSPSTKTVFIRFGSVTVGVTAHEMTHAYAHVRWNDFLLILEAYSQSVGAGHLDEAVTSALADSVTHEHHGAKRGRPPSGFVGYVVGPVPILAGHCVSKVDNALSTPGARTMEVYFGGHLSVHYGQAPPSTLRVTLGAAKKRTFRVLELLE